MTIFFYHVFEILTKNNTWVSKTNYSAQTGQEMAFFNLSEVFFYVVLLKSDIFKSS